MSAQGDWLPVVRGLKNDALDCDAEGEEALKDRSAVSAQGDWLPVVRGLKNDALDCDAEGEEAVSEGRG